MADQVLDHLAALIDSEQKEIIRTWQDRVRQLPSAEGLDELALQDSVADLLDEIATTMLADREIGFGQRPFHSGPMHHASQRHELGFNIGELVIEYMVLREILQEFAQSRNIALDNNAGIVLHRVIDAAISASVQAYEREQVKRTGQQVQERLAYLVHELKTPLSAAHTAAMLLENRLSKDALKGVGTMLHILLRNCERLEAMVLKVIEENVASPSRDNEHLDPGVFQLRPLVQGILENVRSIVENESISVRNEVPEDLYIYADDFLMSQVIQNLLSNALKYTPKGEVVVGAESKAEHALLWVQDTGTGIEPQMLDRIFQKNVGDPDRPESTGLGLAIVQKIVEAHRGKIHVESTVGQGSRFVIELPPLPAAV